VNKANLIAQIAQLANDKKLDGIADIQDYSDREGMRIVIDLKRDAVPAVVLNQLYKHTQMQTTFGAIMLALVDGAPKEMTLKELLEHFIEHRHTVITRRTEFELKRAQDREHILEGFKIAVDHIDEVVRIIRKAKDVPSADAALRKRFKLSEKQSAEILNMRLARLTALEITKLEEELKEVRKFIKECKEILASKPRRLKILKEELSELAHGFGDERRTEIVADQGEFSIEDLIAEEDMVITVSHAGYIKRLPVSAYRRQRRGGKGVISAHTKEDDWVEHLFIASTHDYVMFFTQQGQCYWLKVHEIPQAARAARGGIVDEKDLHAALTSGVIAAAGIDVLDREPPDPDNPLLKLANIITAPHMAGVTVESIDRMAVQAVKNVLSVFDGAPIVENIVNPEVL